MKENKIPVIIDTDIGDDIDDAFALCLAMKSPELDILGVTTVFKNTVCRARMASRLLRLGGFSHVPVRAGCGIPLSNPEKFGFKQDFYEKPLMYLDEMDDEPVDVSQDAADYIIHTLEQSKAPITLITLGALTNIAEILRRRPEIKSKIQRIVMMGGAFLMNFCEHNIACDPEAARMVMDSGVEILGVGLDVTFKCKLNEIQLAQLEAHPNPCIKLLMAMRKYWSHEVFLHDPLAVAAAFDESFVTTERRKYAVELNGSYTRGMMVHLSDHNWQKDAASSNLTICTDVDAGRFTNMCAERLLSFNSIVFENVPDAI